MDRSREGPPGSPRDLGFTLIELLVVVLIIGILAAVAVPAFVNQRVRGYDASAKADLRQLAELEESHLVSFSGYGSMADIQADPDVTLRVTPHVTLRVVVYDGVVGYCLSAKHAGSPTTWYWDSLAQGLQPGGAAGCPVSTTGTPGGAAVTG